MTRRLRVLMASPRFAPQIGGAETWTLSVLSGLVERGHAARALAGADPGLPRRHRERGVEVSRAGGGRAGLAVATAREVARSRPDAVLAQYSALPFATAGGRAFGVPVVGVVHDVYGLRESLRIKGFLVGWARHLGLDRSLQLLPPAEFLVPSRSTADRLRPYARGRMVTVVPSGVTAPEDHGSVERDHSQVIFVGRLVHQKGVADLLEALRVLRNRGRPARLVVVGDGPEEGHLRAMAADLDVRFMGFVDEPTLHRLLGSSAVLALPSTREGWGLVLAEAAARGLPYVAYDLPAIREQHDRLRGGVVVQPNPEALADSLERLIDEPKRARALGEEGRSRSAEMTWDTTVNLVEEALIRVVERRRPAAR